MSNGEIDFFPHELRFYKFIMRRRDFKKQTTKQTTKKNQPPQKTQACSTHQGLILQGTENLYF